MAEKIYILSSHVQLLMGTAGLYIDRLVVHARCASVMLRTKAMK